MNWRFVMCSFSCENALLMDIENLDGNSVDELFFCCVCRFL